MNYVVEINLVKFMRESSGLKWVIFFSKCLIANRHHTTDFFAPAAMGTYWPPFFLLSENEVKNWSAGSFEPPRLSAPGRDARVST